MELLSLPECIFIECLQPLLSHRQYRNLLNTTKHPYFLELKRKSCCYFLYAHLTSNFFSNYQNFRERLLPLIDNPSKQLGLHVIRSFPQLSDIQQLRSLILSDGNTCKSVGCIFSKFEMSALSAIPRLHLSSCLGIHRLSGLNNTVVELQLSQLQSLHDISILSSCLSLTKVSIIHCRLLANINSLSHVKILHVESCPLIDDQGMQRLGNGSIKQLTLKETRRIRSINHITSLEKLVLERVQLSSSLGDLPALTDLTINYCPLFALDSLPVLKKMIVQGTELFTFTGNNFPNLKEMFFLTETRFSDENLPLHCLSSLHSLQLQFPYHSNVETDVNCLSTLSSLRKLELHCIQKPSMKVHLFQQIIWLSLTMVNIGEGITEPMPNLQVLRLNSCERIKSLKGLEKSHNLKLSIEDCKDFLFDESFYQILWKNVEMFWNIFHFPNKAEEEFPIVSSTFQIHCDPPEFDCKQSTSDQ